MWLILPQSSGSEVLLPSRRAARPRLGFGTERIGAIAEKVVVKQLADLVEQGQVDAVAFQHLVDIRAVAVDGVGKPGHGAPLGLQFPADHLPYVYLHHRGFPSPKQARKRS